MSAYHERIEPAGYYDPPDTRHCPGCDGCEDPVSHCYGPSILCDPENTGDEDPKCGCACLSCRANRKGVPQCDDDSEHRTCAKCAYREDY